MGQYTEQDVLDLAADMKQYRIDAQNSAISKGYNINTSTDKLEDLADKLLADFQGKHSVWPDNPITIAQNSSVSIGINTRADNYSITTPGGQSASETYVPYTDIHKNVTITAPNRTLPQSPVFGRVLFDSSSGETTFTWIMYL